MKRAAISGLPLFILCVFVSVSTIDAQTYVVRAASTPLPSLREAILTAPPSGFGEVREILDVRGSEESDPSAGDGFPSDPLLNSRSPLAATFLLTDFAGSDNDDNLTVNGGPRAPPSTNGDVGPNHYVQMVNGVTTVFDKSGVVLLGPFPNNLFWTGLGGLCEADTSGYPFVLYDEDADRWVVSEFAYNSISAPPWRQCVAVSRTGDPLGAYNGYELIFDDIGYNDIPNLGISSGAITISAHIWTGSNFQGSFLGAMDKAALYAGAPTTLVGQIVSSHGVVASDYDDPGNGGAPVGPLFGTPFFADGNFTIWELVPDFVSRTSTVTSQNVPISPFNGSVPNIPQPSPGSELYGLSSLTMPRLKIRDFTTHLSMMTNHTVNVGSGRAGIRWYEFRSSDGGITWGLHQEGTYAPDDGENRWVASIAMNGAGDIGLGFLLASTNTFGSIHVVGQTATEGATASGVMDAAELICRAGDNVQTGTSRAGTWSAMNVDPITDNFWYTQEYFNTRPAGQHFHWDTHICEFHLEDPCPATLTLADRPPLTGTQAFLASSSVTLGPNLVINGSSITVEAPTVSVRSGTEVRGTFSVGNNPNCL